MTANPDPQELAREAKAIVALAFRDGPIEDVHAGTRRPGRSVMGTRINLVNRT